MKKKTLILSVIFVFLLVLLITGALVYKYSKYSIGDKFSCVLTKIQTCTDGSKDGPCLPANLFCSGEKIVCMENDKYFVITTEKVSPYGSPDFLIKYKKEKNQSIPCKYDVGKTDFEIKNQEMTNLLTMSDNFLVLDSGTAPLPRAISIYNLNTRKKVYSGLYSMPMNTYKDTLTYWEPTDIKITEENCPESKEWLKNGLGAHIESHITLDLTNLIKKELGEYRCSMEQ